jgi:uncharacterized protein YegP (UPF0339 family)
MRFEIDTDIVGQFIWRLKAANNLVIANGESYVRKAACETAINLVKAAAWAQYTIYKDTSDYWRWRLRATNNEIIAKSSESYYNEKDCTDAAKLAYAANAATPVTDLTAVSARRW